MRVRLATPADIAAMIEMERQCPSAAHWTEGQYQRVFQTTETDASQRLALAIDGDHDVRSSRSKIEFRLIAFLIANHLGSEWELENVVVESTFRRQGLGTRLLNELLAQARGGANSQAVFLEVRESNHAARALYLKWGFEQHGRRPGYYTDPSEDAILYRRSLP